MSDQKVVGRGGLKLEAAIARFGLAGKLRGAQAIDIGASTGGFTECMLRHGAARVVAIDVGHGQLHPSLLQDPRVESLERVDWKTLSLGTAPGPFDFFTVDVSFVAARNMLRGLAFRLRPGAEGVVLVKPQFELPDTRVRGGDVSALQLRQEAVAQVQRKAESLGFSLVAQDDSPVAGGSGTVEILAHLRFEGRSERLPQPGEKRARPIRGSVARGATLPDEWRYFAVAAPGVEPVLEREVAALPDAVGVQAVDGGVEFRGPLEVCYRANLWLRTATRVLVRVGELEAREFARLRRRTSTVPWEAFVPQSAPLALHVSQSGSRLYHTGAIGENLGAAIDDRLGRKSALPAAAPQAIVDVFARGVKDRWTLSVDSSGELLHRRGWREEPAQAPMRETLAAALLALCEWDPATPFVDPLCGAGTLPLEACALALHMAPALTGGQRSFAFERWPLFERARYQPLVDEARAAQRVSPPAPIAGSDHSARALEAALRNAERAGLAAHVRLTRAELAEARPPAQGGPGLLLCNPPYGRRVGDPRQLRRLYSDIGRLARAHFPGWQLAVLVADPRLEGAFGMPLVARHPLSNGGIRVQLLRFRVST